MTTQAAINMTTDNELLESYESAIGVIQVYKELLQRIEMEIFHRIEARGGTSLPNADENGEQVFVCEIEETLTYDQSLFVPLKEMLNKTELNACYEPEHEKTVTVPAKWLTQQVKAIAKKHGDGAVEIVEYAKMLKDKKLKFRRI